MEYTITEINQEKGWIALDVTLGDGTLYKKKMMADLSSPEALHADITKWAKQYEIDRVRAVPADLSAFVGKPVDVNKALPKTLATVVA